MERMFITQTDRFSLRQPNVYVLQGYFQGNSIVGSTLRAFLDGRELPLETSVREGLAIRQKYIRTGNGSDYIDREYDVWITMPENFSAARRLELYQYRSGERRRVFRTSAKRLIKKQRETESYLESWKEENGRLRVGGWAAASSACRIQAVGADGRKIPAEVTWRYRGDVLQNFPELQEIDTPESPLCLGFDVVFNMPRGGRAALIVAAKGQRKVYKISARAARKQQLGGAQKPSYLTKGLAYLQRNGWERTLKRCAEKLLHTDMDVNYDKWRRRQLPSKETLDAQRKTVFSDQPLISIVVPLYRTPEHYLRELVASVQAQTYRNWELCLSDGSGADSPLKPLLVELQKDARIRVVASEKPLGISENTNAALAIASGDLIAFADHDDLLEQTALYECVSAVNAHPEAEMIYTDEDKITMDGKEYFQPHFKPDFNIDLLCSMNYFCHLVVVRKALLERVGMLNPEFNGAQDYDFVLRCVEAAECIYHIPQALYHWRAHKDSTAENPESKRYAFEAGARAVQAHYDRIDVQARVEEGQYPGLYRTRYELPEEQPLVSVVIPNKDHTEDLDKCVQSVMRKSSYKNLEFVIIENNSTEAETFAYYKKMEAEHSNFRVVYWKEEFNYSLINNFGVEHAKGEYLLFLNNDIEMINEDCIEELLGPCLRSEVGIVGARLYYPDDTIQHAGVIIGFGGIAGHAFIGSKRGDNGYFSRIICAADLSAVTAACMMVKRSVFEEAGGFDGTLRVAFNDIDFCLRVRSLGKLVVYNPFAELYHYESKSRGYEDTPEKIARFNKEADVFLNKWPEILKNGDPAYNPNLTLDKADFSIRN